MAFGDVIQTKQATGTGTSLSATFDSSITQGNLVVAICMTGDGTLNAPSGYSTGVAVNNATESDACAAFFKVAGASESTTVTATSGSSDEYLIEIVEFEGPWEASPLDLSTANSRQASGTTYACSATGTTAQADELAIVICYTRLAGNSSGDSWDSGYTLRTSGNSTYKSMHSAFKVLTATGSVASTLTFGTSDVAMGGACSFKKQAAGGTTVTPIPASYPFTAQAVNVSAEKIVTPAFASFPYAGQALTAIFETVVSPVFSAFNFTGQAVSKYIPVTITHVYAAFNWSGQALSVITGTLITHTSAAFNYTAQAINVIKETVVSHAVAIFSYTGQALTVTSGTVLTHAAAAFAYTGQAVNVIKAKVANVAAGTFNFVGQAVSLLGASAFANIARNCVNTIRRLMAAAPTVIDRDD